MVNKTMSVCPVKDAQCPINPNFWCATCPQKQGKSTQELLDMGAPVPIREAVKIQPGFSSIIELIKQGKLILS